MVPVAWDGPHPAAPSPGGHPHQRPTTHQGPTRAGTPQAPGCNDFVTTAMTLGELFLESLHSGVITEREIAWIASRQGRFERHEEAVAIRLGRLIDQGQINLGCRLPRRLLQHQQVLQEWIEPLGRRRHRPLAVG